MKNIRRVIDPGDQSGQNVPRQRSPGSYFKGRILNEQERFPRMTLRPSTKKSGGSAYPCVLPRGGGIKPALSTAAGVPALICLL
jgi:hypothetical protein